MNKFTSTDLFCGIGLMSAAIKAAGGEMVQAVDHDPGYVSLYKNNFKKTRVFKIGIEELNPSILVPTDHVHLSPPCTEYSSVNQLEESEESVLAIRGAIRVIDAFCNQGKASFITLENVEEYINSQAFKEFLRFLKILGYRYSYEVGNALDYGGCQDRRRLYLRAIAPECSLNLNKLIQKQPVSWYRATKDLLPYCSKSKLSNWQQKRFKLDPNAISLIPNAGAASNAGVVPHYDPCPTLRAFSKSRHTKQFLIFNKGEILSPSIGFLYRIQMFGSRCSYDWLSPSSLGVKTSGIGNGVCYAHAIAVLNSFCFD